MKKYTATVKVIRFYEIGFESPDFKQALLDAETIVCDDYFKDSFNKQESEIVGVRHDDS
jgi:tetraacyldisaccharide-1-P 4'-kinase